MTAPDTNGSSPITSEHVSAPVEKGIDARTFLQAVMAWPGDDDPGYVNVHWKDPAQPRGMPGYACKTVDELLAKIPWMMSKKWDVYYCTSLQQEHGKLDKGGKFLAHRDATLSIAHKVIYLDTDIKEGKHGYATDAEQQEAFKAFLKAAGLPPPSASVHTGGGRHVYWISDRPLPPGEWRRYAEGLKALVLKHGFRCDVGVIADACRVLRIPETTNFKKADDPRPVRLEHLSEERYDFAKDLAHIAIDVPAASAAAATHSHPADRQLSDFCDPKRFPKPPSTGKSTLAAGIDRSDAPLNPAPIFGCEGCPFFRTALETGGNGCHEPEWAQHMLGATFMERGRELAHRMSDKHPGYDPAATDAKFDSKLKARKDGKLGWPSCEAIRAAGCDLCTGC